MKILKIILGILIITLINSVFADSPSALFPKEILFFDRLVPNDEQVKIITNDNIRFTGIGVTVNENVTRARVIVQAMPDCPENAPYQKNVLQCFYVYTTGINENQVINATILFKIPKKWIEANNYDKNTIELKRYSYSWNEDNTGKLSSWKTLKTALKNEDNEYYNYETISDGFFYFSIVGNEKIQPPIPITAAATVEIPEENHQTLPEQIHYIAPEQAILPKTQNYSWIFGLVIGLVSISIAFAPRDARKVVFEELKEQTAFEQLTKYIKETNDSEKNIRNNLKEAGWDDWQINLAINEIKK